MSPPASHALHGHLPRTRRHGNITLARQMAGVSRDTLYAHRKRDAEFREVWERVSRQLMGTEPCAIAS